MSSASFDQSAEPARTGAIIETKASPAETVAIGMLSLVTHLMPARFTAANKATRKQAIVATGTPGSAHWLMAAAENRAVSPQVGTHPHQYATPVNAERIRL